MSLPPVDHNLVESPDLKIGLKAQVVSRRLRLGSVHFLYSGLELLALIFRSGLKASGMRKEGADMYTISIDDKYFDALKTFGDADQLLLDD